MDSSAIYARSRAWGELVPYMGRIVWFKVRARVVRCPLYKCSAHAEFSGKWKECYPLRALTAKIDSLVVNDEVMILIDKNSDLATETTGREYAVCEKKVEIC